MAEREREREREKREEREEEEAGQVRQALIGKSASAALATAGDQPPLRLRGSLGALCASLRTSREKIIFFPSGLSGCTKLGLLRQTHFCSSQKRSSIISQPTLIRSFFFKTMH
jgi:hypothetical protein